MLFSHFSRFFFLLVFLGSLLVLFSCKNPFAASPEDQPLGEDDDYLITISEKNEASEGPSAEGESGIFVDFPSAFDEKNVLPLDEKALDEKENRALVLENKLSKKKSVSPKAPARPQRVKAKKRTPSKTVKRKKPTARPGLAYVRKLYYGKQYSKIARMSFAKDELDGLFFKALALRAISFKNAKGKRNTTAEAAKMLLNRIALTTEDSQLKAKSLLWLAITELQFPTYGKPLKSRMYPLRYLETEMANSRGGNDALLYTAFFYEDVGDYEKALGYYYKLKQSDPDNMVYDFRIKKLVSPHAAANHYLTKLENKSGLAPGASYVNNRKEKPARADQPGIELPEKETKAINLPYVTGGEDGEKDLANQPEKKDDFEEIRRKLEIFKTSPEGQPLQPLEEGQEISGKNPNDGITTSAEESNYIEADGLPGGGASAENNQNNGDFFEVNDTNAPQTNSASPSINFDDTQDENKVEEEFLFE